MTLSYDRDASLKQLVQSVSVDTDKINKSTKVASVHTDEHKSPKMDFLSHRESYTGSILQLRIWTMRTGKPSLSQEFVNFNQILLAEAIPGTPINEVHPPLLLYWILERHCEELW